MASLKRIQVKGFKSIREMDLELHVLNVLIGANGSGENNFLSVFTLLANILNLRLSDYIEQLGGADYLLHYGQKETDAIDIKITDENSSGYEANLPSIPADSLMLRGDFFGFDPKSSKLREEFMIMDKSKRTRMIYLNNGLKPIVRSLIDFSIRLPPNFKEVKYVTLRRFVTTFPLLNTSTMIQTLPHQNALMICFLNIRKT